VRAARIRAWRKPARRQLRLARCPQQSCA
jgi:hypothetical protein